MKIDAKITVFGDSISKGYTTKNSKIEKVEKNVVSIIEERYGIVIDNRSTYGQTLSKVYERGLVDDYIKTIDKDADNRVVFSIGGNDSDYDWRVVAADPDRPHEPKTPLAQFGKILNELINKLQSVGVTVYLTTLAPVDSKRYFESVISQITDGEQVLKFFKGDITNINRHQECFNYEIIKAAVMNKCRVIDIRSCLLMNLDYLSCYSTDGIHPNEFGHSLIAEEVIKIIDSGKLD